VSPDSADLKWTPPTSDGGSKVKGYHVYMATSPGEWTEVGQTKSFDEKFTVPNLTEGQSYYFAVAAENDAGVGPKEELDKPVIAQKPKGNLNVISV
jgi:titin